MERELSSSRADSHALAASTTALAYTRFSVRVTTSMYETPWALPSAPTMTSLAIAPVSMVSLPVFIAGGMSTWLELKLEAVTQPLPHCPQ